MNDEKNEITLQDLERRLATLEKAVTSLTAEKNEQKPKAPISFEHLGGKYVGGIVSGNKKIDFSSIPGVRCVMPPPSRAEAETKSEVSVEKEDDARE